MTKQTNTFLLTDSMSVHEEDVVDESAITSVDGEPEQEVLPVVPLKNTVVFPGAVTPITIGRAASIRVFEKKVEKVLLVTQRPDTKEPTPENLHDVGVVAKVVRLVNNENENLVVLVQGRRRVRILDYLSEEPYLEATVAQMESSVPSGDDEYWTAAVRNLRESAERLISSSVQIPDEARIPIQNIKDPKLLIDMLIDLIGMEVEEKQELLEEPNVAKRLETVQATLNKQLQISEIQEKLREDVHSEMTDLQRNAYLREQMRAIQKELGEEDSIDEQLEELAQKLRDANLPEGVQTQVTKELKRLRSIPMQSPEHSVAVTYLETIAELPWSTLTEDNLDLKRAREVLDADHYGLEDVKKRIIEYLAVRKLNPKGKGPILCLQGPPGVGKTSLGKSVANALGREFARISVGGVRDEAEIRGHRRTYVGSMPGRLLQELRRVGTRNPVILLDEIDKMGADFRGDPASALLEVLDPAQNHEFTDHYVDMPFDLSQVIFIATSNRLDTIPAPLRDRMEVIDLPGYTEEEKARIATRYLVKRQLAECGLGAEQCIWDEDAIAAVIADYTREAGVRNLEREIGAVVRSIAAAVAQEEETEVMVDRERVESVLGAPKFLREDKLKVSEPGVVTGLAYTSVGGDILHIEAIRYRGKGNVKLTGQLGDVMKESVQAAWSLVRSRAEALGIDSGEFEQYDVHVHVPAGAIPKDGPSAGAAMFTALASLFAKAPVRADVAMTGEVTLRGLVLPIGGLKEKALAALRAGISTILIPELNRKDIPELSEEAREKLTIIPVENVDEVLHHALECAITPLALPS